MKQCSAVTLASTYSAPHRCLKRGRGLPILCAHHAAMAARVAEQEEPA